MSDNRENGLLNVVEIRQFISYFVVGGVSAFVEWVAFWLLGKLFGMAYLPATALAFIFSTSANWFLGRTFTFKNSNLRENKTKEIFQVFGVSGIGLVMNLGLMYLFVSVLGMKTDLLKTAAKILATGIVFIWNYLSRKLWIYKNAKSPDKE